MRCSTRAPFGAFVRLLARAGVLVSIGLLVSACAASHTSYDAPANVGAGNSGQVAMSAPSQVELEEDGVAVQAPPRRRENAEPDDPSEPFSPNYGPAPEGSSDPHPNTPARRATLAPTLAYRSRTTPMTDAEANDIIVQAMIAHEQRNP